MMPKSNHNDWSIQARENLRAVQKVARLPKEERLALLRRAGIIDAKGKLTPRYKPPTKKR